MSKQLKDRITDAIRALAEGNGATLEAIALQPDLMNLDCVVTQASDDGDAPELDVVAGAVALLLEEAANSLDPDPHRRTEPNEATAARIALGLEPGTQGKQLRGRRGSKGRADAVARWLGYQTASLFKERQDGRSTFDALIDGMADYLVRYEVAHLVNERRLTAQARRPPLESAMRVDWLTRFESYYRIWTPIAALVNDLKKALEELRESNAKEADYFARKSLYYCARFNYELRRFEHERGGLWVLPDAASEQLVADATWMIRKPTPLTEVDESMLRLAIAEWDELAIFFDATHRDPALRRIAARWREWIGSCDCKHPKAPKKTCKVHDCIQWGASFTENVDQQWDLLADWYQVPRPQSAVDAQQARPD